LAAALCGASAFLLRGSEPARSPAGVDAGGDAGAERTAELAAAESASAEDLADAAAHPEPPVPTETDQAVADSEVIEAAADKHADKPADANGELAERADEAPPIDSVARQVDGAARRARERSVSPKANMEPLSHVELSEFEAMTND
jgi:hypothetical protein